MNKYLKINILTTITLLIFSSCEKEITIDLNKSNPKYVIEGNLSNIAGEAEVKITKTLNFDQSNIYPTVSGALVTISDTILNKTDTLIESKPGIYTNQLLVGEIGHFYKLEVKIGTEVFSSTSTIPKNIKLDSLIQQNLAGTAGTIGPPAGTPGAGTIILIMPIYQYKKNADKFYQFVINKNDTLLKNIITRSILPSIGLTNSYPLFIKAKKNDVLKFDMQFIDKKEYDYLTELSRNIGQFSATPSNPTSNINNGALGFFKAHTSQKKIIIVK